MLRPLRRLGVPLACLALLVVSQQANADFRVVLTQTGGSGNPAPLTLHDTDGDGVISKTTPFGAFSTFILTATSNYPGTNALALLQTISLDTRNSSGGSKTLTIEVFSDSTTGVGFGPDAKFTKPGNSGENVDVMSSFGTSFSNGASTYDSTIDATPLAQLKLPAYTGGGTPPSASDTISYMRGSSFILNGKLAVSLGNGQSTQLTATTQVTSAVPAPAALVLCVSAVPFLGAFGWYRRRARVA